jgi:hypothetical protein
MKIETRLIPTVEIWPNTGQIAGLPANPRFIRDERSDALLRSIIDDPDMLELRECIVIPYADAYVALAGNMRYKATAEIVNLDEASWSKLLASKKKELKEKNLSDQYQYWLGHITNLRTSKSIPCKIIPADTPVEKLRAIVIKDNVGFGQDNWDMLEKDWDLVELEDFGMIMMDFRTAADDEQEDFKSSLPEAETTEVVAAAPPVELKIVFDDLQVYDTVKLEVEELLKGYPGAKIKV